MVEQGNLERIVDKYGQEYMLRQLAEECAELAQAALKLIRVQHMEGTPVEPVFARARLMNEVADVSLMLDVTSRALLTDQERAAVEWEAQAKANRMINRLLGGDVSV